MSRQKGIVARLSGILRRLAAADSVVPGSGVGHRPGLMFTICILVALTMWLALSMEETYTVLVQLDTRVINLPPDTALTVLPPQMVQARIRGTGTSLFSLRADRPVLDIDGSANVVALESAAKLPQDVSVVEFFPRSIVLRKEERIARRVPVLSRAVLETEETYDFFTQPVLLPDSVDIVGARSIVSAVQAWPTEAMQRSGFQDTVDVHVPLSDTLGELVQVSHTHVRLRSRAHRFTEAGRILPVLVTDLPTSQPPVELDPGNVEVTYLVALSDYDAALQAEDFYATVPYDIIRTDTTGRVSPRIHLPTELLLRPVQTFPRTLAYYIYIGTE